MLSTMIQLFLSILSLTMVISSSSSSLSTCRDFTYGQCDRNWIDHVDMPGGNVTACQSLCQDRSDCNVWRWHVFSEQCDVATNTAWACNILAGPDTPDIDDCLPAGPGCDKFRDEDCSYDGPTNNQMDHMPDPKACQMFMNELGPDYGGGVAFVFTASPKGSCQMLASKGKTCAAVTGPKIPDYDSCF